MLNRFLLVLAAVFLLTGCTSTKTFDLRTATEDTFYEFNAKAQRREARIRLTGFPLQTAMEVQVRTDSTFWRDPRTGRPRGVPTAQISEIRFRDNQMVRGIIAGAGFGGASALAFGENCSGVDPTLETCYGRFDLMPVTALTGGILGGVIGSRGTERFLFITPPAADETASRKE